MRDGLRRKIKPTISKYTVKAKKKNIFALSKSTSEINMTRNISTLQNESADKAPLRSVLVTRSIKQV